MRVRLTDTERPCSVLEGEFIFGAQVCAVLTKFVETDTGQDNPICVEHIAVSRRDLDDRTEGADGAPLDLALNAKPAPKVTASPLDLARRPRPVSAPASTPANAPAVPFEENA